jgi:hypothetical protein
MTQSLKFNEYRWRGVPLKGNTSFSLLVQSGEVLCPSEKVWIYGKKYLPLRNQKDGVG